MTNTTTATETSEDTRPMHRWEVAGLGRAPYKFIGSYESKYQACHGAPVQPGTSCDVCAQGIMYVARFESADGKQFKTGFDCMHRAAEAEGDSKLERKAKALIRKHNREVRHARESKLASELDALLADASVCAKLDAKPSPIGWRAAQGESLLFHVQVRKRVCGAKGRGELMKLVRLAIG